MALLPPANRDYDWLLLCLKVTGFDEPFQPNFIHVTDILSDHFALEQGKQFL